ncbi:MAG: tetratricopeptide repeat protein [Candidatus Kapaibacterium sp.]
MKKSILLLFILFTAIASARTDSLLSIWENKAMPDSSRIIALAKYISFNVINTNPDSAKSLNDELYLFSEMKKNEIGLSEAYNNYAILCSYGGDYRKALDYLSKGLKVNEKLKSKSRITNSLTNIAYMYNYLGEYDLALNYNKR